MIWFNVKRSGLAVVDDCDQDLTEISWYPVPSKHTTYLFDRGHSLTYLHRTVLARILNRTVEDYELVDHIDRNGMNNSRSNLRLCTQQQNMWNRKGREGTAAGLKGVSLLKGRKKCWAAYIRINGKNIRLGAYLTPEEAHAAYCEAGRKYFGEFFRAA